MSDQYSSTILLANFFRGIVSSWFRAQLFLSPCRHFRIVESAGNSRIRRFPKIPFPRDIHENIFRIREIRARRSSGALLDDNNCESPVDFFTPTVVCHCCLFSASRRRRKSGIREQIYQNDKKLYSITIKGIAYLRENAMRHIIIRVTLYSWVDLCPISTKLAKHFKSMIDVCVASNELT